MAHSFSMADTDYLLVLEARVMRGLTRLFQLLGSDRPAARKMCKPTVEEGYPDPDAYNLDDPDDKEHYDGMIDLVDDHLDALAGWIPSRATLLYLNTVTQQTLSGGHSYTLELRFQDFDEDDGTYVTVCTLWILPEPISGNYSIRKRIKTWDPRYGYPNPVWLDAKSGISAFTKSPTTTLVHNPSRAASVGRLRIALGDFTDIVELLDHGKFDWGKGAPEDALVGIDQRHHHTVVGVSDGVGPDDRFIYKQQPLSRPGARYQARYSTAVFF